MTTNSDHPDVPANADRTAPAADKPRASKSAIVLKRLKSAKGASLAQLCEATGWQAHSMRGFLSGTVKTKLGLNLISAVAKDGVRRYRIEAEGRPGNSVAPGDSAVSGAGSGTSTVSTVAPNAEVLA